LVVVSALVVLRSLVFALYEQAYFDSDQAIVGLMAKHLSEGRALPLFFYGQPFMLAVEAWWAVPFFWIGGPTVGALRASLIATNLAAAILLIAGLVRWGGLRPALAGMATLFFTFAPPFTSAHLVEAQGGNVEPLFWVPLLWFVRARPIVFGALLAVAYLNREFAIFAMPVLVASDLLARRLFTRETIRHWLLAAVAFLVVFDLVQSLKPYADLNGPGTRGELYGGFAQSQFVNLTTRMEVKFTGLATRTATFGRDLLPALIGGRRVEEPYARQGREWMFYPLAIGLAAIALRLGVLLMRRQARVPAGQVPFAWYLTAVGLVASASVVLVRPIDPGATRYLLLSLFIPIGLVALVLALEPRRWIRSAVVAGMIAWAGFSAIDHVRQVSRYRRGEEPNTLRTLADTLVARGITITDAPYWRAYKITFLAREQVKVASTDFIRIDEYQRLANAQGDKLRRLSEQPCDGGEEIAAGWYLCGGK
jgi:hypothetical protein